MFDFSELLVFLKSVFDAIMAFVKKLGLKIGEQDEDTSDDAADE